MFIYYDEKTDFFEVLERRCENISNEIEEGIFEIRSQSSNKIIGYSILDASKRIKPSDIEEMGFWEIVEKVWERNKDIDPKEIERDIRKALAEVRFKNE